MMCERVYLKCLQCGKDMETKHLSKKYCSRTCKRLYLKAHSAGTKEFGICRECGTQFPKHPGQNAKCICSAECRKARLARSVREFHKRRPSAQAVYRQRTRDKLGADSQLRRFYAWNPSAPKQCEACGESRVLEIAHKPDHARLGERRSKGNCEWPRKVWLLCPTCHKLLDRMNYSPEELGLIQ